LSILRSYNVTAITRVAGEAIGDYWIDFVRPSNGIAVSGHPTVIATASDFCTAFVLLGGGDGLQNTRVRIRLAQVVTAGAPPVNASRVMVAIF
jgi:hypothetical protein